MIIYCTVINLFCRDGGSTHVPLENVANDASLEVEVASCHGPGCFDIDVNYTLPIKQIVALTDLSNNCFQHIQVVKILRLNIMQSVVECGYDASDLSVSRGSDMSGLFSQLLRLVRLVQLE